MAVSSGKGYIDKYCRVLDDEYKGCIDYFRNTAFKILKIPVERFNYNGSI